MNFSISLGAKGKIGKPGESKLSYLVQFFLKSYYLFKFGENQFIFENAAFLKKLFANR